jgi:serine protease Do
MRKIKIVSQCLLSMMVVTVLLLVNHYIKGSTGIDGFDVIGNIKGLKNGSKLLILIKRGNKIDTVSTAVSKNEQFVFKNVHLPVTPGFYLICIQTEFVENLNLFLDQDGDVNIKGNLKSWPSVTVMGSKIYDDYLDCKKLRKEIQKKDFLVKYPDGSALADTVTMYTLREYSELIKQRPESNYLPYAIANLVHNAAYYGYSFTPEMKKPLYEMLSPKVKESRYGKILRKQIENWQQSVKWIDKLKSGAEGLTSVSKEEVEKQLLSAVLPVSVTSLLMLGKFKLDEKEILNKTKAATLIVNMAYVKEGVEGIQTNPTTAYTIDEKGICVTNYHVFKEYAGSDQYKSISVLTAEGKTYPVTKVLSCSESDDLVVFQVDTNGDKLSALPLGDTAPNGTAIYVMSHPMQNFYRFTFGVIAGNTTATLAGQACEIMKITADFNVGSSGGPIVDGYGNVVGTVSRIDASGAKVGIPVSALKKLIEFKK